MPQCIQCGVETPREEMFGAGTDLRCPRCAKQKRVVYAPPRSPVIRTDGTITKLLIGIAAVIFVLSSMPHDVTIGAFRPSHIDNYLDANPIGVWSGQLWRLVTSTLVHGNFLHIFFNCYWLWRFGPVLEGWMGKGLYLGLFVVLAVSSVGVEMMATLASPIGLSGVVYGMFGLLYALRRTKDFAAALMDQGTVQVMVFWFFLCILLSATNTMGIANWAHGVGALVGWLLGWAYLRPARQILIPFVASVSLLVGGASFYMPWNGDFCRYQAILRGQKNDVEGFNYWMSAANHALVPPRIFNAPEP